MAAERDIPVRIPMAGVEHAGVLGWPPEAHSLVLFAHGSGSSRLSPRNTFVAQCLQRRGIATLLFDLLTEAEDREYRTRFDIGLLTRRLLLAMAWVAQEPQLSALPLGLFGASTGAAAALQAAAARPTVVGAVVSRGGRPDLASADLVRVRAPILLIVGGADDVVINLNRQAYAALVGTKALEIVPGASHLFEEPGALERVADLAATWFSRYLVQTVPA
jgi:dienelactone hydrolase